MIKIKFPSPDDLSNEDWFEQMELTLYHAKKAYEKFIRGILEEERKDVSLRFNYPEMENNKNFQDLMMNEEIPYEDSQEVELVIGWISYRLLNIFERRKKVGITNLTLKNKMDEEKDLETPEEETSGEEEKEEEKEEEE